MEDILDIEITNSKKRKRKSIIILAMYIPVVWFVFYLCSPVFVKIYYNEIGDQLPAGQFIAGFQVLMLIAAIILLYRRRTLHARILLILFLMSIVAFSGMVLMFAFMTGEFRSFQQLVS